MRIVPAKPDDAAVLTEIAFAAKRHWGYPESWIQQWKNALVITPEYIRLHSTHAAIDDGKVVAFSSFHTSYAEILPL